MFLESKEQLQSSCRRATSLKLLHKMWRMREGEQKGLQLSLSGHKYKQKGKRQKGSQN